MGLHEQERSFLEAEATCLRRAGLAQLDTLPTFTFSVASDIAVIGHDGEFADFDNPRGEIHAERFFMVASDSFGRQYRYGWESTPEAAETVFLHFAPPVSEWPLWRCQYGSLAYEVEGCELDALRGEMEHDLGPDWLNQLSPELQAILY